jgi:hypothetical protein
MSQKNKFVAVVFFCLAITISAWAQEKKPTKTDSTITLNWLTKSFLLKNPDTGFVALDDGSGFEKKSINATLKIVTLPGKYDDAKKEFLTSSPRENSLKVDVIYNTVNKKEAVSFITEEISPDKTQFENFILIMTLIEVDDVVVMVIGAYPKSHDKLLRQKFIETTISIKSA